MKIEKSSMKILNVNQIREADLYTIENEPIADIDLMERASQKMAQWFVKKIKKSRKLVFIAGMGNNGGDGYAVARLLIERGYEVEVFQLAYSVHFSPSAKVNFERYSKIKPIHVIHQAEDFPQKLSDVIFIDAIFGSGLSRPVQGFVGEIIRKMNDLENTIISIDVPSGLFIDKSNQSVEGKIVEADFCLSLQFPKKAFLFAENQYYVKGFTIIDIGLHPSFIGAVETQDYFLERKDVKKLLKKRDKFSHKGTFGHGLLVAGSYGMFGAAILASRAALRSGAGLITTHIPNQGMNALQIANPEIMLRFDPHEKYISDIPQSPKYNAIALGPGIGTNEITIRAFLDFLNQNTIPLVLDADALNILALHKHELKGIPKNSILTPHPKEFERLFGKSENDFEKHQLLIKKAVELQVFIVLKGAHTSIAFPDGKVYFNSTGNSGMATAGSGDVLTGILLGLLASGYSSEEATLIGVFLHGKAGDLAVRKKTSVSLISSDIIAHISSAFNELF